MAKINDATQSLRGISKVISSGGVARIHGGDLTMNRLMNYLGFFQGELNVFLISSVRRS